MTPRSRPARSAEPVEVTLPPEVAKEVLAGVEEANRGEFADLTREETQHYIETGELPERVERWLDSYDSRDGT